MLAPRNHGTSDAVEKDVISLARFALIYSHLGNIGRSSTIEKEITSLRSYALLSSYLETTA